MCKTQCGGVTVFKGETGADGVGVTSTVDNGDGTFTITYTDGTTFTSSDLTGPQGPPGTGVSGTGQNQKIAFWDGVSSLSYNSLFSFVDSATVPTVTLLNSTDSLIQVNASSGFNHASNSFSQLTLQSFTDTAYPIARLKRQRGSNSAATPALSNDILGQLNAASETDNFSIEVRATENQIATTNGGSKVSFKTVKTGDPFANLNERLSIEGDGKVRVAGIYKLPDVDGTSGQVIKTDGAGNLTWQTPASGGGMTWNLLTGALGATTLAANNGYLMRDISGAGPKQLTLPSTGVAVGDKIEILATDEGGAGALVDWDLLEGNVNDVIFYTYWVPDPGLHGQYMTVSGNKSASPLLTFTNEGTTVYDTRKRNAHFTLTCVADLAPGYTWQINALDGQVIN